MRDERLPFLSIEKINCVLLCVHAAEVHNRKYRKHAKAGAKVGEDTDEGKIDFENGEQIRVGCMPFAKDASAAVTTSVKEHNVVVLD